MSCSVTDKSISGLVSIIIPAHNAERWIKRCVFSALSQTYKQIEVLIIENASNDNTVSVIEEIEDERVHLFFSEKGVSNARNKGIDEAQGEYITFLDADDWLEKEAIERLMDEIDVGVDIVCARYYNDDPFEKYKNRKYGSGDEGYILKCLYTPTKRGNVTANLYRKKFINERSLRFDPELIHAEDSVFFISLLLQSPVIVDLEEPVYHVSVNPNSATRDNIKIDSFCKAIVKIYKLLENKNGALVNGGYIFALNQLLVILVHLKMSPKEIEAVCDREIFREAISYSDISDISFEKRTVFQMIKKKQYLLLYVPIIVRRAINYIKMKKQCK